MEVRCPGDWKMFDVWKNALAEIEREVPSSSFATWFTGVTLEGVEDGVATIGVPNFLKQNHIRTKYNDIVSKALAGAGVEFKEVKYVLIKSGNTKVRKSQGREVGVEQREERVVHISDTAATKPAAVRGESGLNPKYTLDNFVVGSNNDLAASAARVIVEYPGQKYNPFFLYGGPGLGKTHLVQAIGNEILRRNPEMRVRYIPINHFYSEFIRALQNGQTDKFRAGFEKLDVLIVDDFQFIVGKDKSQVEFFDIFNDMHQANKQIIVTSDRLPNQIKSVDERLASRLTWGLPADLQMPSFEDRCAILRSKAEYMGATIDDKAIEYIAENVKTNIRDLERDLQTVLAMSDLRGMSPIELIEEGYVNTGASRGSEISASKIVEKVARFYDLSVKELTGKSRVSHIKTARQVAMFLLTEELQMSTTKIASEVGVKDHTTVMHGVKKIREDMKLNFGLREQISEIREKLYE